MERGVEVIAVVPLFMSALHMEMNNTDAYLKSGKGKRPRYTGGIMWILFWRVSLPHVTDVFEMYRTVLPECERLTVAALAHLQPALGVVKLE